MPRRDQPLENAPVIWRLSEIFSWKAINTWLMPSVAINELTLNFTTQIAETSPTNAQTAIATTATRAMGTSGCSAPNQLRMTSDKPIIAPTDRS